MNMIWAVVALVVYVYVFQGRSEGFNEATDVVEAKIVRYKKTGNNGNWSVQVSIKTGPAGFGCASWKHYKPKWIKTPTPITAPRPTWVTLPIELVQKAFKNIPASAIKSLLPSGTSFTCSVAKTRDALKTPANDPSQTSPSTTTTSTNPPAELTKQNNQYLYNESRCSAHVALDGSNNFIKEHGGDPDKQVWKCQYRNRKWFDASSRGPAGWECEDGGPDADFAKNWADTACNQPYPNGDKQCVKCEMVNKDPAPSNDDSESTWTQYF